MPQGMTWYVSFKQHAPSFFFFPLNSAQTCQCVTIFAFLQWWWMLTDCCWWVLLHGIASNKIAATSS